MSLMRHSIVSSGIFREPPKIGPQVFVAVGFCAPCNFAFAKFREFANLRIMSSGPRASRALKLMSARRAK